MSTNSNDPVTPIKCGLNDCEYYGLTKREYFAGLAMQGINANKTFSDMTAYAIAIMAVEQSDALLAELAKPVAAVKS